VALRGLRYAKPKVINICPTIKQPLLDKVVPTVVELFSDSITKFAFLTALQATNPLPVTVEGLVPLLRCRLTSLKIEISTRLLGFDPKLLTQMAEAWPDLTEFKILDSAWYGDSDPNHILLSLPDLYPLVVGCQKLRKISITVHLTGLQPHHPSKFALPTNAPLKEVNFGHSVFVGDPVHVATLLFTLFSRLPWVGFSGTPCPGWGEVAHFYMPIYEKHRLATFKPGFAQKIV
jgi:hypothetical protein